MPLDHGTRHDGFSQHVYGSSENKPFRQGAQSTVYFKILVSINDFFYFIFLKITVDPFGGTRWDFRATG